MTKNQTWQVEKIPYGRGEMEIKIPRRNYLTTVMPQFRAGLKDEAGAVRQALEILRMEGKIFRHPGRGTFVSPNLGSEGWALGSIEDVIGLKVSKDITHPKTKEVLVHAGKKITTSVFNHLKQAKVERFEVTPEDLEGA